jgi:hypothetical protein
MIMKSNFEKLTYFWHVTVDNTYWSIEIIRILRNSKLNGPLVDIMTTKRVISTVYIENFTIILFFFKNDMNI